MPPKLKSGIQIMNLHNCKPSERYDVIVDRTTELGNPYYMINSNSDAPAMTRDEVCDKYQERFDRILRNQIEKTPKRSHVRVYRELFTLVNIYRLYGRVRLFCWCAPKRCHADTLKNYLEQLNLKR